MKKRKIFFLSGKRGGFDAMLPLLNLLKNDKSIDLKVIATDQHLMKNFGNTIDIVKKNFSKNLYQIPLGQLDSSAKSRMRSMSKLLKDLSFLFEKKLPDLLLIYGDRAESFVATFVAINFNIKVCHFQGGDLTGNIDEKFRHSITKLSDYHFVSNIFSQKRILQLGEDKKNVYSFGDSHIDSLKKVKIFNKTKLNKLFKNSLNDIYGVLLFHPDGTSIKKNQIYIERIIKSLEKLKIQIHCIYPCTDIGYDPIVKKYESIKKNNTLFKIYKNLKYNTFINLLKKSKFLIGNSSCGIIESAYLKLPVINLGDRQSNRVSSKNVVNSKISINSINSAISEIDSKKFQNNLKKLNKYYGNGKSYKKAYRKILIILNKKTDFNKKFHEIKS
jgi:UDP-hydrolysing UDP-N-acetyl-D-glucosamine 2-epimerase